MTDPTRTASELDAPSFVPEALGLPWHRRAMAQGAGYFLPSGLFIFIPLVFASDWSALTWALVIVLALAVLAFFLGATLIAHWSEERRWLWLLGLMIAIAAMGWVTDGDSRPWYFAPYVTAVAATLIAWRHARIVIVAVSLASLAMAWNQRDMFGVIMALMAFALGWSIGLGLENDKTRAALRRAEERTAVLAVAAERERIGRDLHDILGHSLTTIAVKADLAGRLVGRSDEQAKAEIDALGVIARQALADVRATASGIREVRLASEVASARSVLEAAGVECRTPSALPVLDDRRSELFGYVVREAVTNVVRHAHARVCTIVAEETSVSIADDGGGMRPGARGTGLDGLRSRVAQAGGRLTVESGGAGTTVRAELEEEAP